MKKVILIVTAVFFIGCILGLAVFYGAKQAEAWAIARQNNQNLAKLKIGMPKEQVLKIMGTPYKVEAFTMGKQVVEFLFYRTKPLDIYLKDAQTNFTPLGIASENGVLLSQEFGFYQEVLSSLPTKIE